MLWYLRLDFASAQPSRIGAEYVDCSSRIGAEWGAEFAELPSIIRRGLRAAGYTMLLVLPSLQRIYVNDQFFPLQKWSMSHKYDKAGLE